MTASCAAILGFERLEELPPLPDASVAEDAGVDAADDAAAPGLCRELGVPPPPTDASAGEGVAIFGALRLLDFGISTSGASAAPPGYNLDRACTSDPATSSCTTNLLPSTFELHAKDKSASGLDNAGFSLIDYISRFSDVLSAEGINAGIAEGRYGAVVRIDGWNGELEDAEVTVEIFPAVGFEPKPEAEEGPTFGPDDEWLLDSRFRVGGVLDASTIRSDVAYVTRGKLVARFSAVTLPIFIPDDPKPFDVKLSDAIVTAEITTRGTTGDGGAAYALTDGVISGRWKSADFLDQVRSIYLLDSNGLEDTFLCEPAASLIYGAVKTSICEARDIRSDSKDDGSLPCDAVSAAARIETYAIDKLGTFVPAFTDEPRCVDGVVPAGDDCP